MTDFWTGVLVALGVAFGIPATIYLIGATVVAVHESTQRHVSVTYGPLTRDRRAALAAALYISRSVRIYIAGHGIVLYRQTRQDQATTDRFYRIRDAIETADQERDQ